MAYIFPAPTEETWRSILDARDKWLAHPDDEEAQDSFYQLLDDYILAVNERWGDG